MMIRYFFDAIAGDACTVGSPLLQATLACHRECMCAMCLSPSILSVQVTRLCRMHQLHSALAFLFTRALSDYAAPAAELLLAHAHSPPDSQGGLEGNWGMKTQTGYKLLVYLKCGICGEAFPPGGRFTVCASISKLF